VKRKKFGDEGVKAKAKMIMMQKTILERERERKERIVRDEEVEEVLASIEKVVGWTKEGF